MSKRGKRGALSPEDREMWSKVTRTLTPMHPERAKYLDEEMAGALEEMPTKFAKPVQTATAVKAPQPPKPPSPPPLYQLEHRFRKKLVRGNRLIDARVDLHGLTQHHAHDRLRGFLYEAQSRGHKVVLVITGKGGGPERAYMDERGILRRMVPQWLAMPDLRSVVIGYEEAHASHGGGGALYVRIRKRK